MSFKAQENGQQRPQNCPPDSNSNDSTTGDRLQFLGIEYKQLSALFHALLAKSKDGDQQDAEIKDKQAASIPICDITYISAAEWRSVEDRSIPRSEYSLLTAGPKGRGESASWYQTFEVHHEPGRAEVEANAAPTKVSRSSNQNVYRLILNGRAELMETLGDIFSSANMPGFYVWIWPFKHLIRHEKKVRARLSEEESKFKGVDRAALMDSENLVNESGLIPESDNSPSRWARSAKNLPLDAESDHGVDPGPESQIPRDRNDMRERHESLGSLYKAAKLGKVVGDGGKSMHKSPPKEDRATETQDSRAVNLAQNFSHSIGGETKEFDRTRLRDELRCLVKFMDIHMKEIYSVQQGIDDGTRTTIAFDHLWQLFKPGDLFLRRGEQERAYMVLHVTGGRAVHRSPRPYQRVTPWISPDEFEAREVYFAKYAKTSPFVLDCFYLDFDGTNVGPLPEKFMFQEFDGEVSISSLDVFPAKFHDNPKQTEKALIKRGKRFVRLTRVDHKYYSGKTVREPIILETQGEVHGEIMIDFGLAIQNFRKENAERAARNRWDAKEWDIKFGTGVIAKPTPMDDRELGEYGEVVSETSAQYKPTYFMEDMTYDNELRAEYIDKTLLLRERSRHEKLSDEALMLFPPRIYGYSLLDRKWYAFDLSMVDDIKDTHQGFEHLVLPKEHKMIMQALVQHHTKAPTPITRELESVNQEFSMDVTRGKGRGLIILLHGVPGVGKTSTAECGAAQTRRPLFPITCGDIGTNPAQVEGTLRQYFDMAHKWGCVLLLDEADVFLAKREKGADLQRNGVVSVFLRVLEYYSGILILTTNRIGEFDEAFSSRVHIKLYYPKLDRKSTLEIWKMNLKRIADSDLNIDVKEDDIRQFARKLWADSANKQTQRWNGRQIRNAFQSAIALAKWDYHENVSVCGQRPCLSVQQFEVVAKTSAHFDAYISTMHGFDEVNDAWETIAQREHLRRNETPRRLTTRSAAAAIAMGGRRTAVKEETLDADGDGNETDSDENEEKVKNLKAELDRRQKKNAPSVKRSRDIQPRKPQNYDPHTEVAGSDQSTSSDNQLR